MKSHVVVLATHTSPSHCQDGVVVILVAICAWVEFVEYTLPHPVAAVAGTFCGCCCCCCCTFFCGQLNVVCAVDLHWAHTCGKEQEGWLQPPLLKSKQFQNFLSKPLGYDLFPLLVLSAFCLNTFCCGLPWWGRVWIPCNMVDHSCWSITFQGLAGYHSNSTLNSLSYA